MLTQIDLNQIERLVREIIKEQIKHLPTKDEFFSKMDKVMGELRAIRQEQKALPNFVNFSKSEFFLKN